MGCGGGNAVEGGCAVDESVCAHGRQRVQDMEGPIPKCRVLEGAQGSTNRESPGAVVVSPSQRCLQVCTDASASRSRVRCVRIARGGLACRSPGGRVPSACDLRLPSTYAQYRPSCNFKMFEYRGRGRAGRQARAWNTVSNELRNAKGAGAVGDCCTTLESGHDTGTKREGVPPWWWWWPWRRSQASLTHAHAAEQARSSGLGEGQRQHRHTLVQHKGTGTARGEINRGWPEESYLWLSERAFLTILW